MLKKTCCIIILLIAGLLVGCSNGLDKGAVSPLSMIDLKPPTTPDGTNPVVSAWSPQGDGIGVSVKIQVRFSEVMNSSTVNELTFLVTASGITVPGKVSYNPFTRTFTFTPKDPLTNLTDYSVTISGSVTDKTGTPMATDFTWSFSTHEMNTLPAPAFDPICGTYDTPQSVTITHDAGSTLYYTLDGSDPTDPMNPNLQTDFSDPVITVNETMTIKAYTVMSGWSDSAVTSAYYLINPAITSVAPNAGSNTETSLSVTISGERFQTGASVVLKYGASEITGTGVNVVDSNNITCTFNLTGPPLATPAYWSVRVANTDTGAATLVDGFRIYAEPAGIVSWWKLDGDADDSVGPNDGTTVTDIAYGTDRFGTASGAAETNVSTGLIQAGTTGLPIMAGARTMMGWFKIDFLHTGDNYLFGYGTGTEQFNLLVDQMTNRLAFSKGVVIDLRGTTTLEVGRWYHAAVTYDGATATLYLDGMIQGSIDMTLNTPVSTNTRLFKQGALSPWLNGALDDVMVLNTAMDPAGIQAVAANGGYLLPPVNLQASKTSFSQIVVTWDPALDATSYDVFRETSLMGTFSMPLNAVPITDTTYTDTAISPGTLYYYKVRARNATMVSNLTKAEAGFTYGTLTTLTEGFEWEFASWWDIAPTQPVKTLLTSASFGTNPAQWDGNSMMKLTSTTTCTGGCGYGEYLALTKTFGPPIGTPINYFTLSLYYIYTPGAHVGGNFSVYVNNTEPWVDPVTGLVPFAQPLNTGGWQQRSLFYMGDNDINSITIIFYDFTDTVEFDADLLKINYK